MKIPRDFVPKTSDHGIGEFVSAIRKFRLKYIRLAGPQLLDHKLWTTVR